MKSLVLILLSSIPMLLSSQVADYRIQEAGGEDFSRKVLVIPFQVERYYLSDCDKAIAGESKLRPMEVRENFKIALEKSTRNEIEASLKNLDLVTLNDSKGSAFLKRFHRNIKYTYDQPTRFHTEVEKTWLSKVKSKINTFSINPKKQEGELGSETSKEVEAYHWVSTDEDKYMAANWPENTFLKDLVKTYSPEYILTINQFEIKTDYRKCIDRELGNFTRRIRVHFNIFSPIGERLYGDVVTLTYNSTTEDIERIVEDNFGLLGEFIASTLPGI